MNYPVRTRWLRLLFLGGVWLAKRIEQGGPDKGPRMRLPDRRRAVRDIVECRDSQGNTHCYDVSFGLDAEGAIREVFCVPRRAKTGSDLQGLMHDACIAISRALQHGDRIADLANSFGELRAEGETSGPPASPLGAIARVGVVLEILIAEGRV